MFSITLSYVFFISSGTTKYSERTPEVNGEKKKTNLPSCLLVEPYLYKYKYGYLRAIKSAGTSTVLAERLFANGPKKLCEHVRSLRSLLRHYPWRPLPRWPSALARRDGPRRFPSPPRRIGESTARLARGATADNVSPSSTTPCKVAMMKRRSRRRGRRRPSHRTSGAPPRAASRAPSARAP